MSTKMPTQDRFDPIAMEVFSNRLFAITEDMGNVLFRSSFSPNIKERRDCSVGLFDGQGRLIAQAAHMPMHLGSLLGAMEAMRREIDPATIRSGDAYACNDCFLAGGTHLNDITIITPIFHEGEIVAYSANIGHHSDVGGRVPGSIAADSRTVYEEGLRIPIIRLVNAGQMDERLLYLFAHNTREPQERMLDLKAQIAANDVGKAAFLDLVAEMSLAAARKSVDDLLAYTARRLASSIASLKEGSFSFTTYLDDDGTDVKDVPLHVTVTIRAGKVTFDFTGTGPQAKGAMNMSSNVTRATVYYCVKALLDPQLPPNSGMFEGIEIIAPLGCLVNPRSPAATGSRATPCNRLAGAIFGAFREILAPEDVQASSNDSIPAYTFAGSSQKVDGTYVYLETLGGGIGARGDMDGMDASHVHLSNSSNLPVEAMENEYALLVQEYSLVPDSGGAGRQRGGLGFARQIMALQDDTFFSSRSDGHVHAPAGVFGGLDGGTARVIRNYGTPQQQEMPAKSARVMLKRGESMRIQTCGGAGYGAPSGRDVKMLAADLRGGKVTEPRARKDYGDVLIEKALALNRLTRVPA